MPKKCAPSDRDLRNAARKALLDILESKAATNAQKVAASRIVASLLEKSEKAGKAAANASKAPEKLGKKMQAIEAAQHPEQGTDWQDLL